MSLHFLHLWISDSLMAITELLNKDSKLDFFIMWTPIYHWLFFPLYQMVISRQKASVVHGIENGVKDKVSTDIREICNESHPWSDKWFGGDLGTVSPWSILRRSKIRRENTKTEVVPVPTRPKKTSFQLSFLFVDMENEKYWYSWLIQISRSIKFISHNTSIHQQ